MSVAPRLIEIASWRFIPLLIYSIEQNVNHGIRRRTDGQHA
jgi:hypothetical protein